MDSFRIFYYIHLKFSNQDQTEDKTWAKYVSFRLQISGILYPLLIVQTNKPSQDCEFSKILVHF